MGAKIADVGCNMGLDAHYFTTYCYRVTGFDQSAEALAIAKTKFPNNDQGGKVLVPLVRWNIDELKSHLDPHFSILWERHYNMGVSGKPAVSLLLKLTDMPF